MIPRPGWFPLGELKVRLQKAGDRRSYSLCEKYDEREIPAGQVKIMQSNHGFEFWVNGAAYWLPIEALFEQALAQVQANQEAMAGAV